jgi:ankyrin repeat protein
MDDIDGRFANINLEYLKKHVNAKNVNDRWKNDGTSLAYAAYHNKPDCISYLLDCGANVNNVGLNNHTLLYYVMAGVGTREVNAIKCVKLLLDAGHEINDDHTIHNPLHKAIYNQYYDIAFLLIDYGADFEQTPNGGSVPPPQIGKFITQRLQLRIGIFVILGAQKFKRTTVFKTNGRDVIRLIGKHLWSMRFISKP